MRGGKGRGLSFFRGVWGDLSFLGGGVLEFRRFRRFRRIPQTFPLPVLRAPPLCLLINGNRRASFGKGRRRAPDKFGVNASAHHVRY